jgi:hypothetical protein
MSCPDIYINPTHWTTPHTHEYANTAINVGSGGTTFSQHQGDPPRIIQVTVRNHGTQDSPSSRLELFWANPSTGFTLMGQIDASKFVVVPGGDGISTDGFQTENFSFDTYASGVGTTNGGHVCLLAQVQNEASPAAPCGAQGHLPPANAATDARSAIRNIHVNAPLPLPAPKPISPLGGHPKGMSFAFAAADPIANDEESRLEVRALDPGKDRERLQRLVADPGVYHSLGCRRGRFAVPDGVLLAEGTERVVLPRPVVVLRNNDPSIRNMPRIGHLGPLTNPVVTRLLPSRTKLMEAKKPLALRLVPGEMRQVLVHVAPSGEDNFYAISVEHWGAKDRPIGGMTLVFVPPCELL